jgi:hypothetical protein
MRADVVRQPDVVILPNNPNVAFGQTGDGVELFRQ